MSRKPENGSRVSRLTSTQPRTLLLMLLALRCALSLPLIAHAGWLEHEADFYNTARVLVSEGRLPTPADFPDQRGVMLQATQPPLYYALVVPVVALFDSGAPVPPPASPPIVCYGWSAANPNVINPDSLSDARYYPVAMQSPTTARALLRIVNVLFGCAAMALVFASVRRFAPGQVFAPLMAAALLGFEPNTLYFTSIIGNDGLLLLIAAFFAYAAARVVTARSSSVLGWVGIGLAAVLAILARLNGWVLLPGAAVVALVSLRPSRWTALSARTRRWLLVGGGLLLVLVVGIIVVNLATTGSLFGRYGELDDVLAAAAPNLISANAVSTVIGAIARETGVNSYLLPFNIIGRPRIIAAFGWLSLGTIGGAMLAGVYMTWRANRRAAVVLTAIILATCLLVFARNLAALAVTTVDSTTLIYAPLRYYIPGLPAAAILIGLGVARFRVLRLLGLVLLAGWLGITVRHPQYWTPDEPPPLVSASELADLPAASPDRISLEGFPQLVSAQAAVDSAAALAHVRLVATTDQPLTANYAARLEFSTPDGQSTECQFPVANGQYPTMWWQPGELVDTQVNIAACTGSLPAGTRVSLRWAADGALSPAIPVGQLEQALERSPACPPLLGMIDNSLLITHYTAPLVHRAGTLYLPALTWYVQGNVRAASRAYTLTHSENDAVYTCVGEPRQNTYPFSMWRAGETIYFDECVLPIPADAPTGTYRVSVAASDAEGNLLPAADTAGNVSASSQVEVATIEIVR